MDTSGQRIIYTTTGSDSFFHKRHTATFSFLIGILLFLLPFAELKCSSVTLAENSGIGLVLGKEWKAVMPDAKNEILKKTGGEAGSKKDPFKADPAIFAIVALAAGLIGLVFAVSRLKARPLGGMSFGILAFAMLIALMIQYKMLLRSSLSEKNADDPYNVGMIVKMEFTIWYYLSLACFAAAAFFSYKHHVIESKAARQGVFDFELQQGAAANVSHPDQ